MGFTQKTDDAGSGDAPFLDDMDAKITGVQQFIKREVPEGSRWSAYHRIFEQNFYVPPLLGQMELSDKIGENESEEEG